MIFTGKIILVKIFNQILSIQDFIFWNTAYRSTFVYWNFNKTNRSLKTSWSCFKKVFKYLKSSEILRNLHSTLLQGMKNQAQYFNQIYAKDRMIFCVQCVKAFLTDWTKVQSTFIVIKSLFGLINRFQKRFSALRSPWDFCKFMWSQNWNQI